MTLCVFEAAAKETGIEDQREKLKSLGFHERASFDSFHHFLDRVKRAIGNRVKKIFNVTPSNVA